MTVMEFFGCSLIAFGPPLSLFYFTIAHDPVRIILVIASAFFWLLSLLLSSLWWKLISPLQDHIEFALVFSVLFQEGFRFLLYLILKKAEGGLKKVTESDAALIENKHILAYVAGLGFGIMSGAFALVNGLADSVGPGTMGLRTGGPAFLVTSAWITLSFILLHTAWNVLFCHAMEKRNFLLLATVVVLHLAASCVTLLNKMQLYWATIPLSYANLLLSGWLAMRISGAVWPKRQGSLTVQVPAPVD